MRTERLDIPGLILIKPDIFPDDRGFFFETFQQNRYKKAGISGPFVQDNLSFSKQGVLRGLHYQWPYPQAKLVQCLRGEILDIVVDIRRGSPVFRRWISMILTGENGIQLYIPEGCAHGFLVTSDEATFVYKCTDFYMPECDRGIVWNDIDLAIDWPLRDTRPVLSEKDRRLPALAAISNEHLPLYQGMSSP